MRRTIGCIGCGNMGSAILGGFAKRLPSDDYHLCVYTRTPSRAAPLEKLGVELMPGIAEIAAGSDILIFAVKPHQLAGVLQEVRPEMNESKIAVSIAAAFSLSRLRALLGDDCFIARCMPTTTALVGRGVFAFCVDPAVLSPDSEKEVQNLFSELGMCINLPESRFNAYSALIGAAPAYIFDFLQGLVQAGITVGFSRQETEKMLIQLVGGCSGLAATQDKTFLELRDDVCSPGGLTIAGINVLSRAGLAGLVVEAVRMAEKRGHEMES